MIKKINTEPFVEILKHKDYLNKDHSDLVTLKQQLRQEKKFEFYQLAFDFISENNVKGDYFEFGVHKARTFRMALSEANKNQLNDMYFHAFDSFEGLPGSNSHSNKLWNKGALTTSEKEFLSLVDETTNSLDRVKIIKGFYNDSLTNDLKKNYLNNHNKIAFLCVDCDLYESAVPVFNFVSELITVGSIIYLDDFNVGHKGSHLEGVSKAFTEFSNNSRFKFREFLNVGWWGKSFITYME